MSESVTERPGAGTSSWIDFLKIRIGEEMRRLEELRRLYARFDRGLKASPNAEDQNHLI